MSEAWEETTKGKKEIVSWSFKNYSAFTDEDKRGLHNHLKEMPKDRISGYIKYLENWCNFPKGALDSYKPKENV